MKLSSMKGGKCMRETRKISLQQKDLPREHLAYLSLNLLVQEVWLTAKCYLFQNQNKIRENEYSCKGISKKHNGLCFVICVLSFPKDRNRQ